MKKFSSNMLKGLGPVCQGVLFQWTMQAGVPIISYLWLSMGFLLTMTIMQSIPRGVLEHPKKSFE